MPDGLSAPVEAVGSIAQAAAETAASAPGEIAGSAAEIAAETAASASTEALDTAAISLADTIGQIEQAQGPGAALDQLAEGGMGQNAGQTGQEFEDVIVGQEGTASQGTEGENVSEDAQQAGPENAQSQAQAPTEAQQETPDAEAQDATPQQEGAEMNQEQVLTEKVEALNTEVQSLTESVDALKQQQEDIIERINTAMAEIPELEAALYDAMSKATPENRKKLGILLTLLKLLGTLIGTAIDSASQPQKKEQQAVQPKPPVQNSPIPFAPRPVQGVAQVTPLRNAA